MAAKDSGSLATISTSNPQITIDEFTFVLIQVVNLNPRYSEILEIHSYKSSEPELEPTKFWVYRSNSELGFWRLCVTDDEHKGHWYKGIDYVQSTFIDIRLQVFINENISYFGKKKIYYNIEKNEPNICFTSCPYKSEILEQINDESRIISEEPFLTINNYDKKSIPIGCGRIPRNATDALVNSILQNFSIELKEQYRVINVDFISRLNFDFENILKSEGEIYAINLGRKTPHPSLESNNIIIYFMKTKLYFMQTELIQNGHKLTKNITRICGKPFHIFPFFITSRYGTITNLGLFNKYIPSGLFICKLFDYGEPRYQCTVEERANEQCSVNYSYIGKRYSNLFPLNEAVRRLSETCSVGPGTMEEEDSNMGMCSMTGDMGMCSVMGGKKFKKTNRKQKKVFKKTNKKQKKVLKKTNRCF
jgi:hypothetical protein